MLGKWYLIGHNQNRYQSLACDFQLGDDENDFIGICAAKMQKIFLFFFFNQKSLEIFLRWGTCMKNAEFGHLRHNRSQPAHFVYEFTEKNSGQIFKSNFVNFHFDENLMIFYGCFLKKNDGTCFADREELQIWSRAPQPGKGFKFFA